jgi:hypothetical protein
MACVIEKNIGDVSFLVDDTGKYAIVTEPSRRRPLREPLDSPKRRILNHGWSRYECQSWKSRNGSWRTFTAQVWDENVVVTRVDNP